jgi:hypothetical protein
MALAFGVESRAYRHLSTRGKLFNISLPPRPKSPKISSSQTTLPAFEASQARGAGLQTLTSLGFAKVPPSRARIAPRSAPAPPSQSPPQTAPCTRQQTQRLYCTETAPAPHPDQRPKDTPISARTAPRQRSNCTAPQPAPTPHPDQRQLHLVRARTAPQTVPVMHPTSARTAPNHRPHCTRFTGFTGPA